MDKQDSLSATSPRRSVGKWNKFEKFKNGKKVPFATVSQEFLQDAKRLQLSVYARMLLIAITMYLDSDLVLKNPSRKRLRDLAGIGSDQTYEKAIRELIGHGLLAKGSNPETGENVLVPFPHAHEVPEYYVANYRQGELSKYRQAKNGQAGFSRARNEGTYKDSTSYYNLLDQESASQIKPDLAFHSAIAEMKSDDDEDAAGKCPPASSSSTLPRFAREGSQLLQGLEHIPEHIANQPESGSGEQTTSVREPDIDLSSGEPLTHDPDWYSLSNEARMTRNLKEYDPGKVIDRSLVFSPQNVKAVIKANIQVYPDPIAAAFGSYGGDKMWQVLFLKYREMAAVFTHYLRDTSNRLHKPVTQPTVRHTEALTMTLSIMPKCQAALDDMYDEGVTFRFACEQFFLWMEGLKVSKSWVWPMMPLFADEWRGALLRGG